jgi:hypothetical protein
MVLIVGAAVGLAALRNANEYWATAMAAVVAVLVGASIVGAIRLREREQYGRIGFAVFSVLYLGVTVGNFLPERFKDPFRTSDLLNAITNVAGYDWGIDEFPDELIKVDQPMSRSAAVWRSRIPGAANTNEFVCVGHCLFALLFGLVGTVIGRILYARRERAGT